MREPLRDRTRLEHIVAAIDNVVSFTEGKNFDLLESDKILFYAVVKNIEIIGEAAYRLSKAFCDLHPQTKWKEISRMRHVLVHDYYQIDNQTVWAVIQYDLPELREQLVQYIENTDWNEWEKRDPLADMVVDNSILQIALRMKKDEIDITQISKYTGLDIETIKGL